jgi:hypothetical protein
MAPGGPPYISAFARPTDDPGAPPACSFRAALCVHAGRGARAETVLGTLADLERARRALVEGIGAPPPLADGRLGGGSQFDLYLVPPDALPPAALGAQTARDDLVAGPQDRASAFALLREDTPSGCVRQNLVTRALASSIQWGLDAGDDPTVREANAAYLAELVAPCGEVTDTLVDDFQAHPELALFHPSGAADQGTSMVFPWYLDWSLGSGAPGTVPLALTAIGTQTTAPALCWNNEPDLFDVLRGTLQARTPATTLDDLWMDFAVTRLFLGARDDGTHFPEGLFSGAFGKIRFDWLLPYATLPRRVTPEEPIEPTGASYVFVGLRHAPPGARLAFAMQWEPPVVFRWALVRLRADGSEASRVLVTPQQKSTSAEKTLEDLDGLSGVVVVGVNVGDLRPGEPFDPDAKPYEPHGYVLTVARAP